jgi:hypothetical protein
MISKMHVDMDLNTKAVRHVTENDQVVNNILKGLEKTIIDLSHTNESESTPRIAALSALNFTSVVLLSCISVIFITFSFSISFSG